MFFLNIFFSISNLLILNVNAATVDKQVKTVIVYDVYYNYPEKFGQKPGGYWLTGRREEKAYIFQDGSFWAEFQKDKHYLTYSAQSKEYSYYDFENGLLKSVNVFASKIGLRKIKSEEKKCGTFYKIAGDAHEQKLDIVICLKKNLTGVPNEFNAVTVGPTFRKILGVSEAYFLTYSKMMTSDGTVLFERALREVRPKQTSDSTAFLSKSTANLKKTVFPCNEFTWCCNGSFIKDKNAKRFIP